MPSTRRTRNNPRLTAYNEYKSTAARMGLPVNTSFWNRAGYTTQHFKDAVNRMTSANTIERLERMVEDRFNESLMEAYSMIEKMEENTYSRKTLMNKIKDVKRKLPSNINKKTPALELLRYYNSLTNGINEYIVFQKEGQPINEVNGEENLNEYEMKVNNNYQKKIIIGEDKYEDDWRKNFELRMENEMTKGKTYYYVGAEIYRYNKIFKKILKVFTVSKHVILPTSFKLMDFVEYAVLDNIDIYDNGLYSIDIRVFEMKKFCMNDLKMKGNVPPKSMLLEAFNDINIEQRDGFCVIDYLHEMIHDKAGYSKLSKVDLIEQFKTLKIDVTSGISLADIMRWKSEHGKYLNIYACDPFRRIFESSTSANSAHTVATLIFMVNNKHLYPIINQKLNLYINNANAHKDKVSLGKIEWSTEFGENEYVNINSWNYNKYVKCDDNYSKLFVTTESDEGKKICVVENCITRKDENGMEFIENKGLYNTMIDVIKKHNVTIDEFNYDGQGQLKAFVHPINKMVFVANDDLNERIATCKTIFEEHAFDCFRFKNQSFCSIAKDLQKVIIGELPKTMNNEMARLQLDYYSPSPLIQTIYKGDWKKLRNVSGCDIFKCYSSVMYNMEDDYPVYSIHDSIQVYDGSEIICGEYYIESVKLPCGLMLPNAFYHYGLVKFLLTKNYIQKSNIKKMIKASMFLSGKLFRPLIEYVYNKFNLTVAKQLINTFIGSLNMKYNKVCEGCICTDEDTVQALFWRAMAQNMEIKFNCTNNIYLCKQYQKTRQLEDNCSIWRTIISGGIKSLLTLVDKLSNNKSLLIGVNTDSVFIQLPNEIELIDEDNKPLENLGKYREEEVKPKMYRPYEPKTEIEFQPKVFTGVCYNGIAGSGKTQRLIEDIILSYQKNENFAVMSFTNNACQVLIERYATTCQKIGSFTENLDVNTFSSLLSQNGEMQYKMIDALTKLNTIYIDEFYMTPNPFVSIIYQACMKNLNLKVVISGDSNQCNPVETKGKIYDYTISDAVKQICPNLIICPYIENSARYNKKLKLILDELLQYNNISHRFSRVKHNKHIIINLCKFNKTRIAVNKLYCDYLAPKNYIEITCHYQQKEEPYKCFVGMPVMCTQNMPNYKMYNSQKFTIEKITNDIITVHGNKFTIDYVKGKYNFGNCFVPAYCVTVYKYQGGKIEQNYNILDAEYMDKKELYTALSRATNDELIHVDNLRDNYTIHFDNKQYKLKTLSGKIGYIYEISFSDGSFYVGSTTTSIEQRLNEHLENPDCVVYAHRYQNPQIKELTEVIYVYKKDLFNIEKKYITMYENLEKTLINKNLVTKPETTVECKITINKYVELYPIHDTGNSYDIQVRRNGKSIFKRVRYGKRLSKEEAHERIIEIQKNLNNA